MTLGYTYDGSTASWKVAPTTLVIPSRAELGTINQGGLTIDDPGGTVTLTGWKTIAIEEDACSQPRLWTGWATSRSIGRSADRGQFMGATARAVDLEIVDLNALFYLRVIHGSEGKRPVEDWVDRLSWILGSPFLSGLIADHGYTRSFTRNMDAADYRGQVPADVLNDLAARIGPGLKPLNYFAFWEPTYLEPTLFFDVADATTFDSTIFISNDPADVDDSTTFAPSADARIVSDPSDVYSEVYETFAGGHVFRSNATTAAAFIERGTTLERPTKDRDTAKDQADEFLQNHDAETNTVTVTVRLPAAKVGLIQGGMRVKVKFTHLADLGYDSFTWLRCVSANPKPTNDTAREYDVQLELTSSARGGTGAGGGIGDGGSVPPVAGVSELTLLTIDNATESTESITIAADDTYVFVWKIEFDVTWAGSSNWTLALGTGGALDEVYGFAATTPWTSEGGVEVHETAHWYSPLFPGGTTDPPESSYGRTPTTTGSEQGVMRDIGGGTIYGVKGPFSSGQVVHLHAPFAHSGYTGKVWVTTGTGATVEEATTAAYGNPPDDGSPDAPMLGQPSQPETITTDGTTGPYTTNYPYAPGSLHVTAGGVAVAVDETDPTTGQFETVTTLPTGTVLTVWYLGTGAEGTGETNPAPTTDGTIPYPLLGTGGDGSGDNVLHDDGTWGPEATSFDTPAIDYGTPAEGAATTAIRTDATLAPPDAADIPIADSGGYFTSGDVEGALQELGAGGGGGGSLSYAWVGYNTPGASNELWANERTYLKKVSLTAGQLVLSIGAYVDDGTADNVNGFGAGIWTDNSGAPQYLRQIANYPGQQVLLAEGTGGPRAARWLGLPVNFYVESTGDYWIGVYGQMAGMRIYYDGSGTDRYFAAGGNWTADYGRYTPTTTSNKYSIRALVLG